MSPQTVVSILAVLVVYGKPCNESNTLQSLADSLRYSNLVLDLLIYDNSPELMTEVPVNFNGQFCVSYLHDPSNAGISAAYNAGARLARQMGKKWLLLLDQDTTFPPEAMAVYARAVSKGGDVPMFVPRLVAGDKLLSPCGYLAGVGYHLRQILPGPLALQKRAVLNSGLLVQLAAFQACGGYDERVRVDFADFAFINRFRCRYPEIAVLDLVCQHGFSNLESVPLATALDRFSGYCRDGRAAAATPLLKLAHAFLVLRRCAVLTIRYRSVSFLAKVPAFFFVSRRKISS